MSDWLGGLFGGIGSMFGSGISSAVMAREAAKNREFQERMFRNRYQIQTDDMRKAGINPILAAVGGPGGSPAGSAASAADLGQGMAAGAKAFGLLARENQLKTEQINNAKWQAERSKLVTKMWEEGLSNLKKTHGSKAATALFLRNQGFGDAWSAGAAGLQDILDQGPGWLDQLSTPPTSATGEKTYQGREAGMEGLDEMMRKMRKLMRDLAK